MLIIRKRFKLVILFQFRSTAWAGVEQIAPPHMLDIYEKRLWHVAQWLQEYPGSAFSTIISILGNQTPDGIWRFLSSSAFLGVNNWFILFSGGMLNPRRSRIKVSIIIRVL